MEIHLDGADVVLDCTDGPCCKFWQPLIAWWSRIKGKNYWAFFFYSHCGNPFEKGPSHRSLPVDDPLPALAPRDKRIHVHPALSRTLADRPFGCCSAKMVPLALLPPSRSKSRIWSHYHLHSLQCLARFYLGVL